MDFRELGHRIVETYNTKAIVYLTMISSQFWIKKNAKIGNSTAYSEYTIITKKSWPILYSKLL